MKNLDGSDLKFPQDEQISFTEETHTYECHEIGKLMPVSSVVGQFFKKFDTLYWSRRKSPNEAAAALLREQWDVKGKRASGTGTFLHKQIEDFLNGKTTPELNYHFQYAGQEPQCAEHIVCDEIINIAREWQYFLDFDRDTEYTPFRTEWRVFDPNHRIAGTIDLLCRRPDGTMEIYDWKRSNKINPDEKNQWDSGLNGLEHLTDTTYMHYCLQQNLYRYILQNNYGLRVSKMNLVVLHPEKSRYEVVNVPVMDSDVQIILKRFTFE